MHAALTQPHILVDQSALAAFCRRWQVRELALFGSVLREDFRPDSDVDVMVTFAPEAGWSLGEVLRAEEELATLLGRKADLVERAAVQQSRNYIRRRHILSTAQVVYAG